MSQNTARAIAICNEALTLLGHSAIHDFEGRTPASEACERVYGVVLGQLLDAYDWRFAMRQQKLTRLAGAPTDGFTYRHQLPNDRDGDPARYYSDLHGSFVVDSAVFSDAVHSDHEDLWCDYVKAGALTGNFRNLLVRALAADLALSLCDDRGVYDRFRREAYGTPSEGGRGGLFKTAISNDARGAKPRSVLKMGTGPLVEAHLGRGLRRHPLDYYRG